MGKTKRIIYAISIILFLSIPAWMLTVVPMIKASMPASEKYFYIGTSQLVDERMDITKVEPRLISNRIFVDYEKADKDKEKITVRLVLRDLLTEELRFDHKDSYLRDKETYKTLSGDIIGDRLNPPLKPVNYTYVVLRFAFFMPINLTYVGKETVKGLETYKFFGTQKELRPPNLYPALNLTDSYMTGRGFIWIEPESGYVVKSQYDWDSFSEPNQKGIHIEQVSNGYMAEESIAERVQIANEKKQEILIIGTIVPVLFFVIALALLLSAYLSKPIKNKIANQKS